MPSLATLQDLDDLGIPLKALAPLNASQLQRVLDNTSSYVLGSVGDKIQLPLVPPYDPAIVWAVVQIACWRLMRRRGFNPDDPGDKAVYLDYQNAENWLRDVRNGKIRLEQRGANPESLQPSVDTNHQRGFGAYGQSDPPFIRGGSNFGG